MSEHARTLKGLRLLGILACFALAGCDPLWERVQAAGLETDVREILNAATVAPRGLVCSPVGTSREGTCSLRLSSAEASTLVRTLALEPIHPSMATQSSLMWVFAHAGSDCATVAPAHAMAFGVAGRPNSLRTPSGAALEYLLLTIDTSNEEACIRVSYAYG